MGVSKTSDHIQINNKMLNSGKEPLASSKAPNEDLKDMDVLCTFKIEIESQNLDHWCIKEQWPYQNQDEDAKPQSGTSSILQNSKWGLKGHWCSLHLQNQDREPKFGSWLYQRPVTMPKIKIKMANPSQEPRVASKAPNEDLKYMDVLCIFIIKIESQNLEHG